MSKIAAETIVETTSRLTFADAAWAVGVTPESFEHFVETSGVHAEADRDGVRRILVTDLMRAAFSLMTRKETQIAMLRVQLASALEREQQLAAALRAGLGDDSMEEPAQESPAQPKEGKEPAGKGKRKKK